MLGNSYRKFRKGSFPFFLGNFIEKYFGSLDYLPRWIIFCIDSIILVVASLISYHLVFNLSPYFDSLLAVPLRYGIFILVNMVYFLLFRTYAGIIRHSSFIDGIKLLLSTAFSFLTVVMINFAAYLWLGKTIYRMPSLVINFAISFLLLFLFRIFVKNFFEHYKSEAADDNKLAVLIYGADANAISVANALKLEVPSRFKIVGFVGKNSPNSSKRILGLPILSHKKKLVVLMRMIGAQGVIIADRGLSKEEQLHIVDQCLEYHLKVYTVPLISDWENQKEISQKVKKIEIADLLERSPIVLDNKSISQQLKGKRILVTGAAGSIGSEIVRQVLGFKPDQLIVLDQAETPLHHLSLEIEGMDSPSIIHTAIADIRDKAVLEALFEMYRPQVVFHAAAYKHVPLMEKNPSQAIQTNIKGTKNLADLSCLYQVEKFVMVSTDKAVNPSNVMGASKRIAEKYVQSLHLKSQRENGGRGTKFITTRFGNVLGSNGSVVPLFSKQIAEGGPVTITHPDIIRYFMTIPEACQLVLEAGAMGKGGEIYIFDMGKPVKIIDLARKMIKLAGFVPDREIKIAITGLRPGEKLYEELLNDTSKTLATHHEKIMIAEEIQDEFESLHADIEELIGIDGFFDNEDIVCKMKKIVPEFISMNSAYEVLDR
ncbi:polysaccharide biosynthesis protein [Flavobacterium granuli]|uniref:FlaA1/EpsC-like NDP-sugar epimerase n=1 Tax=Flavobacterium granuli TaxID=280093 RepID=A0A1M5SHZ8_9FLAO|nr:nucleoside-diphosphate sugar epimerase/dehydratase [Flavobacterium granuli]PRZ20994.1 FlaA1/EpsC-like NDP-sugar epimerase [Flavobacterium granuli]SHH38121.1 NDP-sugar epimerase, includes UDP-GlcNAc-inverting 4,6-dehydratase FlaA1 and capsular polysaccharide biosynthesis protein EpsC [Flavobacterium granuli]